MKVIKALIIVLLIVLVALWIPILRIAGYAGIGEWELAHIIAGEAGIAGCDEAGRVAVAYVAQRNGRWNGWARPGPADWHIAEHWRDYADPTRGSRYLFSDSDLRLASVQEIIGGRPVGRIACGDLGLNYVPEWTSTPLVAQASVPVRWPGFCTGCYEY